MRWEVEEEGNVMEYLHWEDAYSVNVSEIDAQHKKLIGLINEMYDAAKVGRGTGILGTVLKELVDYTVYHFRTEEELFRQYGYPEFENHKKQHDDLTQNARNLKKEFDDGNNLITVELMRLLSRWLNVHVLEEDKKFGIFLNSKGVQ